MSDKVGEANLRVLCFGAGAIGSYIGGSLALSGCQVVFLEQPQVAERIRREGLALVLGENRRRIDHPITAASPEEALAHGPFDVGVFALKSFDTRPALEGLRPYWDSLPPVLCLQNGVENEVALTVALGASRVIAGTVTSAIGRGPQGEIVLERLRGMGVAAHHPLSERLTAALNHAGLNAELFPRADEMKWSKMLTNLLANATSAILDLTPLEIFAHPDLYKMELAQLREALDVMSLNRIAVTDLPGTPVRLLAYAVRFLQPWMSRPFLSKAVGGGRGAKMPSFYIDLHSGRGQSEVDYLNGAVVRAGEKLSLPTPVNRLLRDTLMGLTSGEIPLEEYRHRPDRLLAQWVRK